MVVFSAGPMRPRRRARSAAPARYAAHCLPEDRGLPRHIKCCGRPRRFATCENNSLPRVEHEHPAIWENRVELAVDARRHPTRRHSDFFADASPLSILLFFTFLDGSSPAESSRSCAALPRECALRRHSPNRVSLSQPGVLSARPKRVLAAGGTTR